MSTNWLSKFTRGSKRNGPPSLKEYETLIPEFQNFLELSQVQSKLLGAFCVLSHKKNAIKINELFEALEDETNFSDLNSNLEELIAMGWFRYDHDGPFPSSNHVVLTNDAEIALKTSNKSCLPHKKNEGDHRIHMRVYAKAISLRNKNIDVKAWHHATMAWFKVYDIPLLNRLKLKQVDHELKSIALYMGAIYSIEGQTFEINYLLRLFTDNLQKRLELKQRLTHPDQPLLKNDILEKSLSPRGDIYFKPSDKWLEEVSPAEFQTESYPSLPNTLFREKHEEIKERRLIYNPDIRQKVDTIFKILQPKNYTRYVKETKKNREHCGMILLLSGEPGTGKTELVRQLARSTKRDLLYFDVSKQRNMYLGESEKAIQVVFTKYAEIVRKVKQPPIMFFNESDSILQKRSSFENGVLQTENAVLTILLNEFERFNGILICTTNRPEAMDKAFERRFLMHLEITQPNEITRVLMLKNNFPQLSTESLQELSYGYSFNASHLEVFKQQKRISLISGAKNVNDEEELRKYFSSLQLNKRTMNKIGFKYN